MPTLGLDWIPTADQAGNPPETFMLTNSFGSATLDLGLVISVASPPMVPASEFEILLATGTWRTRLT